MSTKPQPKRADLILFHCCMMPVIIGPVNVMIWYMSQLPSIHTPLLTRALVLAIINIAGLCWWIAVAVHPRLLLLDPSDHFINTGIGLEMALLLWLVAPTVPALIMTVLVVTWIILLRVFPWIPQYRSKRSRSVNK